jgi:hypothetical protein
MQEPVVLNLEVSVTEEDGIATVQCPEELRITERVASVLHQAMEARDLKLKKWVLSADQQKDLEGLTNVTVEEKQEGPDSEGA